MCCYCKSVTVKAFTKSCVCLFVFFSFLLKLNNKYWNNCLCGVYNSAPVEGANDNFLTIIIRDYKDPPKGQSW